MTDAHTQHAPAHPMSAAEFQAAIHASPRVMEQLRLYDGMLRVSNTHMNLVSQSTLDDIWRRHFLDSAQLLPLIPSHARTILDVGSGAGFPGMVLAILMSDRPEVSVHLVEATNKKCRFLSEVAAACSVNVDIRWDRAENISLSGVDVVTARAVAPLDKLFGYLERHSNPTSLGLILKGARANEELTMARQTWDFEVEMIPSRSDSTGVVLCVTGLRRCPKPMKRS